MRQSPIAGAVLANADIDHVLGLLLLRELQPLRVYATDSVRRILTEDNSMFAMLQRIPDQVTWTTFYPENTVPAAKSCGRRFRVALPRTLAGHALSGVRLAGDARVN